MPARTVLAMLVAPLAAGFVYAVALVATSSNVPADIRPSLFGSVVSGSIVGLVFEVLALLPLTLLVRAYARGRLSLFAGGSLVWFAASLALSLTGMAWSSAVALATQVLVPGIVLAAVFSAL